MLLSHWAALAVCALLQQAVTIHGTQQGCSTAAGLESKKIPDSAFTASSVASATHAAKNARLNWRGPRGHSWSWCSRSNNVNQWIQVDLQSPWKVTGIAMQGRGDYNQWVTKYAVMYSVDNKDFNYAVDSSNNVQILTGAKDRNTVVKGYLSSPVVARYIRINPRAWYSHISMRFEVLGCAATATEIKEALKPKGCNGQLGMEDGRIADYQLRASSSHSPSLSVSRSRLDRMPATGYSAWCSSGSRKGQYVEVDLLRPAQITGVKTQSRGDYNQWLSSFKLQYSMDYHTWHFAKTKNNGEVFSGNSRALNTKTNILGTPVTARYVRVVAETWYGYVCMRFDLMGCYKQDKCLAALGIESGAIPTARLSASSKANAKHDVTYSRLNNKAPSGYSWAWCAQYNNKNQWIQADLGKMMKISGVISQGRGDYSQWVKQYYLMYSLDGIDFNYVLGGNRQPQLFTGNIDRNTLSYGLLQVPVVTRYLRIQPYVWYSHISLRFEILGCTATSAEIATAEAQQKPKECEAQLGMESGKIADYQLRASTYHSTSLHFTHSRLDRMPLTGYSAWCSSGSRKGEYVEVDLLRSTKITGIKLQSRGDHPYWLTGFKLQYSTDYTTWIYAKSASNSEVFPGNTVFLKKVVSKFATPVTARYVRVIAETWHGYTCMRFDLLGCYQQNVCMDRHIKQLSNSAITAASQYNVHTPPSQGRLDTIKQGSLVPAWLAKTNNVYQWIQADLGKEKKLFGIIMQGRGDYNQWVKTYQVLYSADGKTFRYVRTAAGAIQIFKGNTDRSSHVYGFLNVPVVARYVRVHPLTWYSHISMRFDVLGCAATAAEIAASRQTCDHQLGVRSRSVVQDSQLTSSTQHSATYAPQFGRLDFQPASGQGWAWIPSSGSINKNQWIQVDLRRNMKVSGVIVQGRGNYAQWVTSYLVMTSLDGADFNYIREANDIPKIFTGSKNQATPAFQDFQKALVVRYVRIQPWTWHSYISLRFEVMGCEATASEINTAINAAKPAGCTKQLGMEDGRIADYQLSASTIHSASYKATHSRLDRMPPTGYSAWCSKTSRKGEYVEVDLLRIANINGIKLQTRGDYAAWLTSFRVQYSMDHVDWEFALNKDKSEVFKGNTALMQTVTKMFASGLRARYVRVIAETWHGFVCMRFDLLGCYETNLCMDRQVDKLNDTALTASSEYGTNTPVENGRLDTKAPSGRSSAWVAKTNNKYQWVQMDLGKLRKIYGAILQGRGDYSQWVTSYRILYSSNGQHYKYARDADDEIQTLKGATDRNTHAYDFLYSPVVARFVRIVPVTWSSHISMRFDIMACEPTAEEIEESQERTCDHQLGVRSRSVIKDAQITASSEHSASYAARVGRLDFHESGWAWLPKTLNKNQWIQVDFLHHMKITGLILQGRGNAGHWVKTYAVMTSLDGADFNYIRKDDNRVMIFNGNTDYTSMVYQKFPSAVVARVIRIQPQTWNGYTAVRFEVLGCQATDDEVEEAETAIERPECESKLGMEDGRIADYQLSASTVHSANHKATHSRLDRMPPTGVSAWCSKTSRKGEYVEVDLLRSTQISGIQLQSRGDYAYWLTSFKVQYSSDHNTWQFAKTEKGSEIFPGNTFFLQTITNKFSAPVTTRFVRVIAETWNGFVCMRFELLGCYKEEACMDRHIASVNSTAITASSQYNANTPPSQGRLDSVKQGSLVPAWLAKTNNVYQWIQVDLGKQMKVFGIIMQGRGDYSQWVKTYKVLYSPNGKTFKYVHTASGEVQVMNGPFDRSSHAYAFFHVPVVARLVRVQPLTWYSHISMRFDVLGCGATVAEIRESKKACDHQLGVRSRSVVQDSQLTSSTQHSATYAPQFGRLDYSGQGWAWIPSSGSINKNQWIQVDLLRYMKVSGVVVQGRGNYAQWVTSFYVMTSMNGADYSYITDDNDTPKNFKGSTNQASAVFQHFENSIITRYVRIQPWTWYGYISMRFEVIGCEALSKEIIAAKKAMKIKGCFKRLGMEDGTIADYQISATTIHSASYKATHSRLDRMPPTGVSAWCSKTSRKGEYIEIDLLRHTKIKGIILQSRGDYAHWLTSFRVQTSQDHEKWEYALSKDKKSEVFQGNSALLRHKINYFGKAKYARFVRVIAETWNGFLCTRFEVIGCYKKPLCMDRQMDKIGNDSLSASSEHSAKSAVRYARLDTKAPSGHASAWVAKTNNKYQWVQMDLGKLRKVFGAIIQGRGDYSQWVTSYRILYSSNGQHYKYARDAAGQIQTLKGATDRATHSYGFLYVPVVARYVRIVPVTWSSHISMRFDILACDPTSKELKDSQRRTCDHQLGVRSKSVIKDAQLTASSEHSASYAAHVGRLDFHESGWAWLPKTLNKNQWIQVDFLRDMKVRGVVMQGRGNAGHWVKSYAVMTSLDGADFNYIMKADNTVMIFQGNTDYTSMAFQEFPKPLVARYVRIQPRTWNGYIAVRFDVLGCEATEQESRSAKKKLTASKCERKLGMEDGRIADYQLSASTIHSASYKATHSRLDRMPPTGVSAWCSKTSRKGEYVEVDLLRKTQIYGIQLQTRGDYAYWLSSFKLQYSVDHHTWQYAKDTRNSEVFLGNTAFLQTVTKKLAKPVIARFVRVVAETWNGFVCARFELLGCHKENACIEEQIRKLNNSAITAQSVHSDKSPAYNGKIDTVAPSGYPSAWVSKYNNKFQWIQADLGEEKKVNGIVMQGRGDYSQWVKTYQLLYSSNGKNFKYVRTAGGDIQIFKGAFDRSTRVYSFLYVPVVGRYVRLVPLTWQSHISMRFDILACRAKGSEIIQSRKANHQLGVRSRSEIEDAQLTASSEYNAVYGARFGRLDFQPASGQGYAWMAASGSQNKNQWIQVDLRGFYKVNGVLLQGRGDTSYWVKTYAVMTSLDGLDFNYITNDDNTVKIFTGSKDYYTVSTQLFKESVVARYVRIQPRSWNGYISLRFDLLGQAVSVKEAVAIKESLLQKERCVLSTCNSQLGMEDGRIADYQLSASTIHSASYKATYSRLDRMPPTGVSAWCSRTSRRGEYVEVNLLRKAKITGFKIQSRGDYAHWLTSVQIQYSDDHANWKYAKTKDGSEVFKGNTVFLQTVTTMFKEPITARYVRLVAYTWQGFVCTRFELVGCYIEKECLNKMGVADSTIPTSALTASSSYNAHSGPSFSRLDSTAGTGQAASWLAARNDKNQWLQVDLQSSKRVTGIILQGRRDYSQWVTSYTLKHSEDGVKFEDVLGGDKKTQVFKGASDRNTHSYGFLQVPVKARYLRIVPQTWYSHIAIRFEVLGCKANLSLSLLGEQSNCGEKMEKEEKVQIKTDNKTAAASD